MPYRSGNIATFDFSNQTYVTIADRLFYQIGSIVFNPEASAFTITTYNGNFFTLFTLDGAGIINDSGVLQNFVVDGGAGVGGEHPNTFRFIHAASAGNLTHFLVGSGGDNSFRGVLEFDDAATAGAASISNLGGLTQFQASSSAGAATIVDGLSSYGAGGCAFLETSNAGTATIINNGALVSSEGGGGVGFYDNSDAAKSTITCNGSAMGSIYPAEVVFGGASRGGGARIILLGDGELAIGTHDPPGVTIGSIEGDGSIILTYLDGIPANNLTVGSNNLSTTFAGIIEDRIYQSGGSLTKIGTGILTLTGANTYTGGTTIAGGGLVVNNDTGSGTGPGLLLVNSGRLIGHGTIAGAATVGTGSGDGAYLAPAGRNSAHATLTFQSILTMQSDATYTYTADAGHSNARTDLVVANGMTIEGAKIVISGTNLGLLNKGTILNVINNTSATPFHGVFSNLPDGAVVTLSGVNLQASYEGGDGNDLTLTVVQ